jgi:hypothetical protein
MRTVTHRGNSARIRDPDNTTSGTCPAEPTKTDIDIFSGFARA